MEVPNILKCDTCMRCLCKNNIYKEYFLYMEEQNYMKDK